MGKITFFTNAPPKESLKMTPEKSKRYFQLSHLQRALEKNRDPYLTNEFLTSASIHTEHLDLSKPDTDYFRCLSTSHWEDVERKMREEDGEVEEVAYPYENSSDGWVWDLGTEAMDLQLYFRNRLQDLRIYGLTSWHRKEFVPFQELDIL